MSVKHVLVVDDEPPMRQVIQSVLEDDGFLVTTATNGAEALRSISADPPDVLVLDCQMPVMDGWAVLRRISEKGIEIPTLVVSGHAAVRSGRLPAGANAWLAKPFDLDDLVTAVEELSESSGGQLLTSKGKNSLRDPRNPLEVPWNAEGRAPRTEVSGADRLRGLH